MTSSLNDLENVIRYHEYQSTFGGEQLNAEILQYSATRHAKEDAFLFLFHFFPDFLHMTQVRRQSSLLANQCVKTAESADGRLCGRRAAIQGTR